MQRRQQRDQSGDVPHQRRRGPAPRLPQPLQHPRQRPPQGGAGERDNLPGGVAGGDPGSRGPPQRRVAPLPDLGARHRDRHVQHPHDWPARQRGDDIHQHTNAGLAGAAEGCPRAPSSPAAAAAHAGAAGGRGSSPGASRDRGALSDLPGGGSRRGESFGGLGAVHHWRARQVAEHVQHPRGLRQHRRVLGRAQHPRAQAEKERSAQHHRRGDVDPRDTLQHAVEGLSPCIR
mmetsp:Transcript_36660/g.99197  ORF Transcript_36660/g.99197 Transcript_36660/m.99197 type:complete len:232 (+) Transcript_36660:99-794(+)